jgi:hypothetical protein
MTSSERSRWGHDGRPGGVKPLLADRLAAALEAVELRVTVLCEQCLRIACLGARL